MARFGKLPVQIPDGVQIETKDSVVTVKGPKGTLSRRIPLGVSVTQKDKEVRVELKNNLKQSLAFQGTTKSHIQNMVDGVTKGWIKSLELIGTGFRAEARGTDLVLTVGYSHQVIVKAPEGIKFSVEKNFVNVEGTDKDIVTATAAKIKAVRRPDPYQGKGIKYKDEVLRKKPGKQAAKGA